MKKLNSSTGSTAVSITLLVFAALCPFLALPAALVVAWMDDHPKTSSEITFWGLAIALAIILAVSPIITLTSLFDENLYSAFNDNGGFFAVTIMEIHLSAYLAWKWYRYEKGISSPNKKKLTANQASVRLLIGIFLISILFVKVVIHLEYASSFWMFLLIGYGITFIFRTMARSW